MRLTPLDIKKQEFTRGFRGFDAEEVQAFLQMLSNQWEDMLAENRRLEQRILEMESKLRHYERIEEALQEALETSRETARQTQESASQKAARIIEEAELRASEIKRDAERQRHDLKRGVDDLIDRQKEIAARLRAFLTSELELLSHYEAGEIVQTSNRVAGTGSKNRPGEDSLRSTARQVVPEGRNETVERQEIDVPEEPKAEMVADIEANEAEDVETSKLERSVPPSESDRVLNKTNAGDKGGSRGTGTSNPRVLEQRSERGAAEQKEEMERIRRILRDLE